MDTRKTFSPVLSATADAAIRFDEPVARRVKGSHHLFRRAAVEEMINLQRDGSSAKPCQVRQVVGRL